MGEIMVRRRRRREAGTQGCRPRSARPAYQWGTAVRPHSESHVEPSVTEADAVLGTTTSTSSGSSRTGGERGARMRPSRFDTATKMHHVSRWDNDPKVEVNRFLWRLRRWHRPATGVDAPPGGRRAVIRSLLSPEQEHAEMTDVVEGTVPW